MIEIKIDAARVTAALERLAQGTVNPAPVMPVIAGIMHDAVMENFERGGRPKWLGLKPATIAQKQKLGYGDKILIRRGRLYSSITQQSDSHSAVVGTNLKYAAIHQFGGTINRAAHSKETRHRTDAKGNLLTTKLFGGKGLIFAKKSHKRVLTRSVQVGAHTINIPARPFLALTEGDEEKIVRKVSDYLRGLVGV